MTSMDELPLRPELRGRTPYGAPQVPARHRLNTNENPHPPSAALIADVADSAREAAADLHRYPNTDHAPLRRAIGEVHGLDPDRIICGVGSDEVLQFAVQAFAGTGD